VYRYQLNLKKSLYAKAKLTYKEEGFGTLNRYFEHMIEDYFERSQQKVLEKSEDLIYYENLIKQQQEIIGNITSVMKVSSASIEPDSKLDENCMRIFTALKTSKLKMEDIGKLLKLRDTEVFICLSYMLDKGQILMNDRREYYRL
jgi:hypothetical protein